MDFTHIDPQRRPRGQIFRYFSKMALTGYSLTVNSDVTGPGIPVNRPKMHD